MVLWNIEILIFLIQVFILGQTSLISNTFKSFSEIKYTHTHIENEANMGGVLLVNESN